jgi:hypothetical protein
MKNFKNSSKMWTIGLGIVAMMSYFFMHGSQTLPNIIMGAGNAVSTMEKESEIKNETERLLSKAQTNPRAVALPAWTDYFGAAAGDHEINFTWDNYLQTEPQGPAWAHTLRGVGRKITGPAQLVAEGWPENDAEFMELKETLSQLTQTRDVIVPVGGLQYTKNQKETNAYFEFIRADGGKQWKKIVKAQAVSLARLPRTSNKKIYWQIGNEANTEHWSESLKKWAVTQNLPGADAPVVKNDHFVIPIYAEYFLAPTIEGLDSANKEISNKENHTRIILTSAAAASTPETKAWLDELLAYKIRGDYAPELAGRYVYELVDIVAIHYLVSRGDENWQIILDDLYKKWVGKGRVRGIWATEELGTDFGMKGKGASTALKVMSRYLHSWLGQQKTPEHGRALFWGWKMGREGTRGEDSLNAVYDFFGDVPLIEIGNGIRTEQALETYLFQSVQNPRKRLAVIFPMRPTAKIKIKTITMAADTWTKEGETTVMLFNASGKKAIAARIARSDAGYTITLAEEVSLAQQAVLVLFLTQQA